MAARMDNNYNIGDVFYGYVTHINSSKDFFVVDQANKLAGAMKTIDLNKLDRVFWLPEVGELFLFYVEGDGFLRATRMSNEISNYIRIKLIDTGEESCSSIDKIIDENLFLMPDDLKVIPPAAFRCVLNENLSDIQLNLMLYKKMTFQVVETKDGATLVDIWKDPKEPDDEIARLRELWAKKEEPINFNAQVAVQGFRTKDDDRRCMFYDSKTGGCFKGGRCKLQHLPDIPDGTCRDTKDIHFYDINSPPLPAVKTFQKINIISFIDTHRFTCHYLDKDQFYNGMQLKDLREELKSGNYERFKELPAIGELVTAKIGDIYYRARVLDEVDDEMKFPVYLVDEGRTETKISYNQIYGYYGKLRDYPFFAIEMKIVDIAINENEEQFNHARKLIYAMQSFIGPLKAFILDNFDDIHCMLYDKNFAIIGQLLVENGLVKAKKILEPKNLTTKDIIIIPG